MTKEGESLKTITPFYVVLFLYLNPLPNMPILGSSNLAANKDMMAKIWTKGGNNYLIE